MKSKNNNKQLLAIIILLIVIGGVYFALKSVSSSDGPPSLPPVDTVDPTPVEPVPTPRLPEASVNAAAVTVRGLDIGMSSEAAEQHIERLLKPETSEGNATYSARYTPQTANGYTLIALGDNLLDDSVKAQEIVAIFKPGNGDTFVLSEYSTRVQCRRGSNTNTWQTQVCP